MALSAPQPLAEHHGLGGFNSGVASLDDWLKRRARGNQASGATRTFVVCENDEVVAYYALASGSVSAVAATGRFRRNMPEPIPVAILARLAVDQRFHGKGFGRALVRDASQRLEGAASALGIRGLVVHAISEEARAFYLTLGFASSPLDPMTLMITLAEIRLSGMG